MREIADELVEQWNHPQIVLLYGTLGTGKTTFVQSFARVLGCKEEVTSPTYSLIQEYDTPSGKIYHVDLYRLDDPTELRVEIGLGEILDRSGAWVFIEWPDIAEHLIHHDRVKRIEIEHSGQSERKIILLENDVNRKTT